MYFFFFWIFCGWVWFDLIVISDLFALDPIKSICTFAFSAAHTGATVGCFVSCWCCSLLFRSACLWLLLLRLLACTTDTRRANTARERESAQQRERKPNPFLFICFSASAAIKLNCQSQRVGQVGLSARSGPVRFGLLSAKRHCVSDSYPNSIRVVLYRLFRVSLSFSLSAFVCFGWLVKS